MKHFLLRIFWWFNYITKFAYLLLAVAVVCVLVERIFKKRLYLLYIIAGIVVFIVGVRMGFQTYHILEFSHPIITMFAAGLLSNFFGITLLPSGSKSSKDNCE